MQQEATVPLRARHVKDAMLPVGTRSGRPLMGAERERKIAEDNLRNMIDMLNQLSIVFV